MAKSKHLRQIVSKYTDDELRATLGTMPDTEVAKFFDVAITSIQYHRKRLNIPAYGKVKHGWLKEKNIKEYISYYNEHTLEETAQQYDCTVAHINWLTSRFRNLGYYIPYKRWKIKNRKSQWS